MASTNIKKSSLTLLILTALTAALLSTIGLWYLFENQAATSYLIAYGVVAFFGVTLISALNLHARRRWLEALNHDTQALALLATEGLRTPTASIQTAELKSLFVKVREERRKLLDLGLTDPLCNVGNRRALDRWLQNFYQNPATRAPLALLLIDIDRFKEINDTHGHQIGDRVLLEFALQLKQRIRSCDQIARLGGDEFCILFPNTRLSLAVSLTRRIRAQLAPSVELRDNVHHALAWTGGVSVSDPFDSHYDQVLWRADEALIRAKMAGRNQTQIFPPNTSRGIGITHDTGLRLH